MSKWETYPADWQRRTLGEMAEYINGYAFKPDDWGTIGLPIIRIAQMKDPDAECDYFDGIVDPKCRIDDGDLLFSWSATLATQIWDRGPAYLNQHLFKVVPSEDTDLHFLHHLLDFKMEDLAAQSHGTTMKHIKRSDLLPFEVIVPPKLEQRRIAGILDTVDAAIRQTDELIAKLQQIKAGLLHDLLTRGLDEAGRLRDPEAHPEQFRETALGRLPAGWEIHSLSEIADVDRGKFAHRPRNDPRFYGGPYPFVQTGDIADAAGGVLHSYSQTLNELGRSVSREFPAGTVAITIAANIADTAILGQPMYFPDSIVGAVVHEPNNPRYVELCIRRAKRGLDAQAPQSAQKNINLQVLRPLLVPVPDAKEQERIAEVYEAHEDRIRAEEAYRDKLTKLKQSLMQDLLAGRVRTTDVVLGDVPAGLTVDSMHPEIASAPR